MTPHDFFIQNIWWMLQEILKGALLRPEKGEFMLQETSENSPDLATQRKLLRVLRGYRAIIYEPISDAPFGRDGKPVVFHLTLGEKFHEAYKLLGNGLKLGLDTKEFYDIVQHWAIPRSYNWSLSGSNLILKDQKLSVSLKKPLDFYAMIASKYPSTTVTFEPKKYPANKAKCLPFEADISRLAVYSTNSSNGILSSPRKAQLGIGGRAK